MRNTTKPPSADSQAFAQLNLVNEDIFELLKSVVGALGGAKKVGAKLFPLKSEDSARTYLLDCLNPDRNQDLGVEGLLKLLDLARKEGVHFGIGWICEELAYTRPTPVDPEDQRAELQRQFIDAVNRAEALGKRLQR